MTRSRMVAGLVLAAMLSAGCTSAPTGGTPASGTSAVAASTPGRTSPLSSAPAATAANSTASPPTSSASPPTSTVRTTVTRTKPGETVTVGAPEATAEPAAIPGECPYLSADVVYLITGQHHGPTQLVALQPHPMCVFYRSDGGLMGSVRVIQAANPQAAVAAVNQHVPVAGSQPATQPAGWVGGSMTTPGQMTQDSTAKSIYAVSKGNIAVVVEEEESPSLKARVMAVCAIYGLGLEPGQAPDYCSNPQG